MRYNVFLVVFLLGFFAYSQVGIGTSSPQAQLDIVSGSAANPSVIDGLLIPRLEKFPSVNPGLTQHAMMVYLSKATGQNPTGFYFWNAVDIKWETISGNSFGNFHKPGTSINPNNIAENMYRTGNIGIGTDVITAKLQIALNSQTDIAIKKGLEVDNNNPAADNFVTYGIVSDNRSASNAVKYGIKNNVGGLGIGIHYGFFNEAYQSNGTNDIYGIFNRVGNTFGAKSDNYGIYSIIGSPTSLGTIYGIYSKAEGNSSAKVFAGYFAGRLGIGLTPAEEYILPATRGSKGQALILDNAGNANWTYSNSPNYSTTGGAVGEFVITEDVYSLRVNNGISNLVIPPANINNGRTIILIAWKGTGNKAFSFSNTDDIYDMVNDSSILSITGSQIMTIQSAGNRWILLDIKKAL
jgi:hypothetical protein